MRTGVPGRAKALRRKGQWAFENHKFLKNHKFSQAFWYTLVISALEKLRGRKIVGNSRLA